MKQGILIVLILSMVACATSPSRRHFPREKVQDIVSGKTTQKEVYKAFGEPIYHGINNKGQEWWMYIHTVKDNSESLSIYFDKEGLVDDVEYNPYHRSLAEKVKDE